MKTRWPKNSNLKKINWFLLLLIVILNSYVILAPFWPQVDYAVKANITKPVSSEFDKIDRSKNQLIISKLQLKEEIQESYGVLSKGIWRRSNTSTPDLGGNTVIVGHRFTYKTLEVPFYHLDKLAMEDKILVVYKSKIYEYKIYDKKITDPNDQTVEAVSQENILTLYTCDPIWTATNRLVYTAKLERTIQ